MRFLSNANTYTMYTATQGINLYRRKNFIWKYHTCLVASPATLGSLILGKQVIHEWWWAGTRLIPYFDISACNNTSSDE
jgi:hypothetical protein